MLCLPAGLTVKAAAINGFVVLLLELLVFLTTFPCKWNTLPCK